MSDSTAEAALKALAAAIAAALPGAAVFRRNEALPLAVPAGGLAILRDGNPGEPEVTMSPLRYEYDHVAECDIHAAGGTAAARDATFDALKQAVAAAVAADRTLGGLTVDLRARAPQPILIRAVEGAPEVKAATVPVVVSYVTTDPLT